MHSAMLLHSLYTHCTIRMIGYVWRFPSITSNTSSSIVSTFLPPRHDCLPVNSVHLCSALYQQAALFHTSASSPSDCKAASTYCLSHQHFIFAVAATYQLSAQPLQSLLGVLCSVGAVGRILGFTTANSFRVQLSCMWQPHQLCWSVTHMQHCCFLSQIAAPCNLLSSRAICCPLGQFPALWGNLLSPGNLLFYGATPCLWGSLLL